MEKFPVLILSKQDDVHADFVGARLGDMGIPYRRADPGKASTDFCYNFQSGRNSDPEQVRFWHKGKPAIDLEQHRSILVRRPSLLSDLRDATPGIQQFQDAETNSALDGLFSPLTVHIPWFNHPRANRIAADKIAQLRCARQAELLIPPTMVTNDPRTAYLFYEDCSRDIIVKSLSSLSAPEDVVPMLFTTRVPSDLSEKDWASVDAGSSILQSRIEKSADIRVAVIGDRLLACRIESQVFPETLTDWRVNGSALDHSEIALPELISNGLKKLRRLLGLRMMHADFCIDNEDRWWFLEANPNGQWLWLELEAGLQVSHAIAEQLSDPLRTIT